MLQRLSPSHLMKNKFLQQVHERQAGESKHKAKRRPPALMPSLREINKVKQYKIKTILWIHLTLILMIF